MALLTKAQILAAEDRRYKTVQVPEWGGDVRVGSMTALQRERWLAEVIRQRDEGGETSSSVRALIVSFCAVDDAGAPLFSLEDVAELGGKDDASLDRVFAAADEINKLTKATVETQKGN